MTREQLNKHWDVIKAFKEGKRIEYLDSTGKWSDPAGIPLFKETIQYRVKPEVVKAKVVTLWIDGNDYVQITPEVKQALAAAGIFKELKTGV